MVLPQMPYLSTSIGQEEICRQLKRLQRTLEKGRDAIVKQLRPREALPETAAPIRHSNDAIVEQQDAADAEQETRELWQSLDEQLGIFLKKVDAKDVTGSNDSADRVGALLVESLSKTNGRINSEFSGLSFELHAEAFLHFSRLLQGNPFAALMAVAGQKTTQLKISLVALAQEHTQLQGLYDGSRSLHEQMKTVALPQELRRNWISVHRGIGQLARQIVYPLPWLAKLQDHSQSIETEFQRLEEAANVNPADVLDNIKYHGQEICDAASEEFFLADRQLIDAITKALALIGDSDQIFRALGW